MIAYTAGLTVGVRGPVVTQTGRRCQRCGARLARDHGHSRCSPCEVAVTRELSRPKPHPPEFWQRGPVRDALAARHLGHVMAAYRKAHDPQVTQAAMGRWLGLTQAQVSRLERAPQPPSDLVKLQRWAATLRIPPDLLWFAPLDTRDASEERPSSDTLDDVHRRDLIKLTGAAVVAGSGVLSDAPWKRLADTLAGGRAADQSTVAMLVNRTAGFFRSEETQPARQLIVSLKEHYRSLTKLIQSTESESLRRPLVIAAGETEALIGWSLFDLGRTQKAEIMYLAALESAKEAGDNPLAACVLGFWSYQLSTQEDTPGAVRMLDSAADKVRGSAATTQSWVTARRAEEQAKTGDANGALRSLDRAVTVFDYATPMNERPWTCFFTPSRLGSLAVSTYGRLSHPETDTAASDLLASLSPSETKVKALVLADLATSAAHAGDFDRMQSLTDQSAPLAVRTEATLAVDRLWDLVEFIPADSTGTERKARERLTGQLINSDQT